MAKSVPEWLNSSLWSSFDEKRKDQFSSPSSNSNDPIHSSSAPSTTPSMAAAAPKIQIIENPKTQKTNFPIARTPNPPTPQSTPSMPHSAKPEQGEFPDPAFPSPEDALRRARFLMELSKKVINLGELRRLAALGIPDSDGIRPIAWKLLIGYLSCDRERWPDELHKKRRQYKVFKEELLVNPSEIARKLEKSAWRDNRGGSEGSGYLQRSEIPNGEHPLSLGKSSVWNQFFQDVEIAEQIDRDVKRTHPDLNFFSGDSQAAAMNREALKRILLIFAKLNPGIRYVQGMNEVLAPLFYIFRSDPSEDSLAHAEADTFFCFVELLSGFRDHFCQQLDNSVVGIRSTISRLSQLLKKHDEELWRHLEITTKVNPQFYAFRWITLLLTQEFNFVDCLHIWDTLLSDPDGPMESLLRICCAMLVLIRRRLLAGDFTANLKLLQHYPSQNISHLLYVADKFRAKSSQ